MNLPGFARRSPKSVAFWQGAFYLMTGLWPLVHMKSFERISGHKEDHWLVKTVGALLAGTGLVLLNSAGSRRRPSSELKSLAVMQAATLAAIDVIYSSKRVISKVYLLDAASELVVTAGWLRTRSSVLRLALNRIWV